MIHICNELEAVMDPCQFLTWWALVSCIQIVQRKQSPTAAMGLHELLPVVNCMNANYLLKLCNVIWHEDASAPQEKDIHIYCFFYSGMLVC